MQKCDGVKFRMLFYFCIEKRVNDTNIDRKLGYVKYWTRSFIAPHQTPSQPSKQQAPLIYKEIKAFSFSENIQEYKRGKYAYDVSRHLY